MKSLITMQPYFVFGTDKFIQYRCFNNGISHLYSFKTAERRETEYRIIPDGCINILFGYDQKEMSAGVYGTVRTPQTFCPDKEEYFGIRLYQNECTELMDCAPEDIVNGVADIGAVPSMKQVMKCLENCSNFEERRQNFMDFSKETFQFRLDNKEELTREIKNRIVAMDGREPVAEIARYFNYSARYINRLFQEKMGLSVKEFCEIVQMQSVLFRMKNRQYDTLTDLAVEEGYYDQAHFTRKFCQYTGMNPVAYKKMLEKTHFQEKIVEVI